MWFPPVSEMICVIVVYTFLTQGNCWTKRTCFWVILVKKKTLAYAHTAIHPTTPPTLLPHTSINCTTGIYIHIYIDQVCASYDHSFCSSVNQCGHKYRSNYLVQCIENNTIPILTIRCTRWVTIEKATVLARHYIILISTRSISLTFLIVTLKWL